MILRKRVKNLENRMHQGQKIHIIEFGYDEDATRAWEAYKARRPDIQDSDIIICAERITKRVEKVVRELSGPDDNPRQQMLSPHLRQKLDEIYGAANEA